MCYVFKKMTTTDDQSTFQDFLDQQQYSKNGVLRYEKIFGPGFVSTGGLDTTKVCLMRISNDCSTLFRNSLNHLILKVINSSWMSVAVLVEVIFTWLRYNLLNKSTYYIFLFERHMDVR